MNLFETTGLLDEALFIELGNQIFRFPMVFGMALHEMRHKLQPEKRPTRKQAILQRLKSAWRRRFRIGCVR